MSEFEANLPGLEINDDPVAKKATKKAARKTATKKAARKTATKKAAKKTADTAPVDAAPGKPTASEAPAAAPTAPAQKPAATARADERTASERTEARRAESSRSNADRAESPRSNADRAESPRSNADRAESPRSEADRAESPRAESRESRSRDSENRSGGSDSAPRRQQDDTADKPARSRYYDEEGENSQRRPATRKGARRDTGDSDSIPTSFSASPDDIDDYGDVRERSYRERSERASTSRENAEREGGSSEARAENGENRSGGEQQPRTEGAEGRGEGEQGNAQREYREGRENREFRDGRPYRDGPRPQGGYNAKGNNGGNGNGQQQGYGKKPHFQKGQGGPNPKFQKFNKKGDKFNPSAQGGNGPQGQPGQQPTGQHPGKKGKQPHPAKAKGGKKSSWHSQFAAASEEDTQPPVFDGLLELELFRSPEQLAEKITEITVENAEVFDYESAYALKLPELETFARDSGIELEGAPQRRKLLEKLLEKAAADKRPIRVKGLVELLEDGFGFVVFGEDNYRLRSDSPFISAALIQRYGLQRGHEIEGLLHPAREGESTPFLLRIDTVMGKSPEEIQHLTPFKELTPYYPTERILLESEQGALGKWDNISMRIVDLLSPVGLGQRGLIVAPPRTGKTVLMQGIANAIRVNRPDALLIILLVDERPEEVTDFRRSVKGAQVVSSTFDEAAESHVHAAEMVIEKARRLVEVGKDVIILLDSITRLARAYNATVPSSGKILSGGVEAGALQKPKRFFGSARNIEGGGSLTILGTALVDTGSKMDEVIFEEFKGTGNMELHLDRDLSNKRVFPALSFEKSGTRKEELLYHPDEMEKVHALRRAMKGVPSTEAMEMLIQRVKRSKTNAQFLMSMAR